jgi:FtsP/CotA-like multicopper oxidase with cupredoxin domain
VLRITKSGFDGQVPGPEFRVKRGAEFAVRVINELEEPTAVHWHGMRLANAMDGAPPLTQAPIAPGASFDYRFVAPDAGTFWYHPPFPNGVDIYGLLIVEEASPIDVDRDVALVFAGATNSGALAINGAAKFDIRAAANQRLRLRLVNASARRVVELRIADLRTFVMATDGQPAQPFAAHDGRLLLGPGNRTDVFVDCTLAPGDSAPIAIKDADSSIVAMIICDTKEPPRAAPRGDPNPLPPNPLPEHMNFAGAFRLEAMLGKAILGKARVGEAITGKRDEPLFTVKRRQTVMLGLSNRTSANGFIHLHGHSFRLLDALDDGWKPFWLDTMPIAPGGKARVAFVADNPGKWLIGGLAENDAGAWFEVT